MVIQDIQEVAQYMEVKFRITLQWVDARVTYYNIKQDENMNSLSLDEQLKLWTPTIVFWNTKEQLRTVNDKNTFANIKRQADGSIIDKAVNEELGAWSFADTFRTAEKTNLISLWSDDSLNASLPDTSDALETPKSSLVSFQFVRFFTTRCKEDL